MDALWEDISGIPFERVETSVDSVYLNFKRMVKNSEPRKTQSAGVNRTGNCSARYAVKFSAPTE